MSDASPVLLTPDVVGGLAGKRVLVVGDIMLDAYLIGDADRISPEAPVPVVRIEKERYLLGGAGNVARNIVALGGVATLAGVMGKDASADRIRGLVRDEGICGAFVALPQRPTTVKTRVMARRQQMLRLDSEDASLLSSADQEALLSVITEQLPAHDVVILSDYSKGIVSLSFMSRLRGTARRQSASGEGLDRSKAEQCRLVRRFVSAHAEYEGNGRVRGDARTEPRRNPRRRARHSGKGGVSASAHDTRFGRYGSVLRAFRGLARSHNGAGRF